MQKDQRALAVHGLGMIFTNKWPSYILEEFITKEIQMLLSLVVQMEKDSNLQTRKNLIYFQHIINKSGYIDEVKKRGNKRFSKRN